MLGLHHPLDDMLAPFTLLHRPRYAPRHELHETAHEYQLTLMLPGVRPEDLKMTFEEGLLSVKGECTTGHQRVTASERLRLPRDADGEAAVATAEHGILTITFPKRIPMRQELTVTEGPVPVVSSDYRLALALPGMRPADLKLTVEDGVLSIAGETTTAHQHLRVARRERLHADADVEAAAVGVENGILTVVLPKRESEAAVHTIKIASNAHSLPAGAAATEALTGAPNTVAASATMAGVGTGGDADWGGGDGGRHSPCQTPCTHPSSHCSPQSRVSPVPNPLSD